MLNNARMTDYSAFLQLYKPAASNTACWCNPTSKPTFPIVLQIKEGEHGAQPESAVIMAIGVLDYIEQKTNPQHLSTMKESFFYSFLWAKMFHPGGHFRFEAATVNTIRVGDRVMSVSALDCSHSQMISLNKPGFTGQTLSLCFLANEDDEEFAKVRLLGAPCKAKP